MDGLYKLRCTSQNSWEALLFGQYDRPSQSGQALARLAIETKLTW